MVSTVDGGKRKADSMALVVQPKKPRHELIARNATKSSLVASGPPRTSGLAAPIMQLSGHQADVTSGRFHPDGDCLATAGNDRQILFWKVYGECENFGQLSGHKNAVTELCFSTDGSFLYSSSADKTIVCWDLTTGATLRRYKG